MTTVRANGDVEGTSNPAIDLMRHILVRCPLVIDDHDLNSHRVPALVLHGEIEAAILFTIEYPVQPASDAVAATPTK